MEDFIIYHHLGLGDHIICNGLVREIIKNNSFNSYKLIVKKHNLPSVRFMFRDIKNISFQEVNNDVEADQFILKNNKPYVKIGFQFMHSNVTWDKSFYKQCDVDFNKRWDSFKYERDLISEENLYKTLNSTQEKYVLIHNKASDGIDRIDYKIVDDSIKKIFIEKHTDVMFDYTKLIENAEEVHCVSSSFIVFVDSLNIKNKIFYHNKNARTDSNFILKLKWKTV
jgi:hypothetical protein